MIDFKKIELGLDMLLSRDGYLLEKNIYERAITHKLAEHLQELFPEWNVDCEYNRNIDRLKTFNIEEVHKLLLQIAKHLENKLPDQNIKIDSKEEALDLIRQLRDIKNIEYDEDLELYLFLLEIDGNITKQTIYPDIIIHHRGTSENYIVIEAKKTINRHKKARLYDLSKLAMMVSSPDYNYNKGIFIDLPIGNDFNNFSIFVKEKTCFQKVFKYLPR